MTDRVAKRERYGTRDKWPESYLQHRQTYLMIFYIESKWYKEMKDKPCIKNP
jgi:hypothetical protein